MLARMRAPPPCRCDACDEDDAPPGERGCCAFCAARCYPLDAATGLPTARSRAARDRAHDERPAPDPFGIRAACEGLARHALKTSVERLAPVARGHVEGLLEQVRRRLGGG